MDFLDYMKICQEESSPDRRREEESLQNNRRREEEGLQNNRRRPDMGRPDMGRPERPSGPACRGQVYKVQKGDTLYSISRKYNLKVRDLMKANPFVNVYQLPVGEELCIPVVPDNRPDPGVLPYVVKREDTVLSILNDKKTGRIMHSSKDKCLLF